MSAIREEHLGKRETFEHVLGRRSRRRAPQLTSFLGPLRAADVIKGHLCLGCPTYGKDEFFQHERRRGAASSTLRGMVSPRSPNLDRRRPSPSMHRRHSHPAHTEGHGPPELKPQASSVHPEATGILDTPGTCKHVGNLLAGISEKCTAASAKTDKNGCERIMYFRPDPLRERMMYFREVPNLLPAGDQHS